MEDRKITIIDGDKEKEMEILFTFEADSNDPKFAGNKYVLYFDPKGDTSTILASKYDDDGHLFPIETDEEWDMVEEVLHAFEEEEAENQNK